MWQVGFHDMGDDYDVPTSSAFSRHKITATGEEDVMELMWQNGQVVVQISSTKKGSFAGGEPADEPLPAMEIRPSNEEQQQHRLFMQEDEMASWLQYPLDDSDFSADILYSAPPAVSVTAAAPPIPNRPEISPRRNSFAHFSRIPNRPATEQMAAPAVTAVERSTVVESNVTSGSRVCHTLADSLRPVNTESGVSARAGDLGRKRKDKEADDGQSQSAGIEFEAAEAKKQAPGSSSTKRTRAAEVHSLSERRRRDRINEKMRALQELIPRCNKSDKASMLDEAIEYLKSLQMQVQMMSMGYGMMYPGMIPMMSMGMGMGMGMGIDMGMNRPMVPYTSMVQGSGIPNPASAAHMGSRFPMPPFNLPHVRLPDPSRIHASNQADPMLNSRMPNFVDPYQQFLGLQQAHLPLPGNQLAGRANADNVNTRKETGNREHQQTGRN